MIEMVMRHTPPSIAAAPTVASFEPSVMALRSGVYTAMVKGPPIAPATRSACSRSRARASTSTKASSMDIVCESDTAGWTRVERERQGRMDACGAKWSEERRVERWRWR